MTRKDQEGPWGIGRDREGPGRIGSITSNAMTDSPTGPAEAGKAGKGGDFQITKARACQVPVSLARVLRSVCYIWPALKSS